MKMQIVILDYRTSALIIKNVPPSMQNKESDEVFEHFANLLKLSSDDCTYLMTDELSVVSDVDMLTAQTRADINTVLDDGYEGAKDAWDEDDSSPEHWALAYNRLEMLTTPGAENWLDKEPEQIEKGDVLHDIKNNVSWLIVQVLADSYKVATPNNTTIYIKKADLSEYKHIKN